MEAQREQLNRLRAVVANYNRDHPNDPLTIKFINGFPTKVSVSANRRPSAKRSKRSSSQKNCILKAATGLHVYKRPYIKNIFALLTVFPDMLIFARPS